ncbi:MAG: hypothetical protein ABJC04_11090, partial [Verrucomicrobiota bacterium]
MKNAEEKTARLLVANTHDALRFFLRSLSRKLKTNVIRPKLKDFATLMYILKDMTSIVRFFTAPLFLAASISAIYGGELKISGFMDQVSAAKIVANSQPTKIKPLNKTKVPPAEVDLPLMSKWSMNYLTGTVTPERDYESSYGNWPLNYPPYSIAGDTIAGGDTECRNDLAFVLMRQMSGLKTGMEIQNGVRNRLLKHYHASGLFIPTSGDTDVIWATTWLSLGLIETYATTGDQAALDKAKLSLETMRKFLMKSDEQGHLWFEPPPSIEWEGKPIKITYRASLDFCAMESYVRYYEVTGDTNMLKIAKGLADGRLDGLAKGHDTGHMHSMLHGVVPIAHLGGVTGDKKYLDWAEARFKETDEFRTDYGWVAAVRGHDFAEPKISETCAVADLMQMAIYLAQGGRTAYWDFVERTMRNYLPQEQFFVDETFKNLWTQKNFSNPEALVKGMGLVRRMEGGFFCRTDPEDKWSSGTLSVEGCCPPTGMVAMSDGWNHIVT